MARPRLHGGLAILLLLCAMELLFFVLMLSIYEAPSRAMISDTIFADPAYRVALTLMLALRLTVVALFVYSRKGHGDCPVVAGFSGVILAIGGWTLLVSDHSDVPHFTGVAVFCAGSLLYSLTLVRMARRTHEGLASLHLGMAVGLLVATCVLVPAFTALYFQDDPNAYLVEHLAYISFLLFYMTFFLYHWPIAGPLAAEPQRVADLPQCAPLLPLRH